jgi:hypothetical protein
MGSHINPVISSLAFISLLTDLLADLFVFDPSNLTWTNLTGIVHGTPPSARGAPGFTSALGRLYVYGGMFNYDIGKWGG